MDMVNNCTVCATLLVEDASARPKCARPPGPHDMRGRAIHGTAAMSTCASKIAKEPAEDIERRANVHDFSSQLMVGGKADAWS